MDEIDEELHQVYLHSLLLLKRFKEIDDAEEGDLREDLLGDGCVINYHIVEQPYGEHDDFPVILIVDQVGIDDMYNVIFEERIKENWIEGPICNIDKQL